MGNEEKNYDYNNEKFQINQGYILNCLRRIQKRNLQTVKKSSKIFTNRYKSKLW